jgi:predicted nucleotidyltransferase component of viral defense system
MAGLSLDWRVAPEDLATAYRDLSSALQGTDSYLAGGTALALMEGHRISVDLDVMSPTFSDPDRLIDVLRAHGLMFETTMTAARTLYVNLSGIQASFFGYAYPLLEPVQDPGDGLLPLAHRDDIAAMKLAAIASRESRKDFVDLWLLVSRHRTLPHYLELYQRKYETRDVGHVIRSLTYFDDADAEPALRLIAPLSWERIKADFRSWVGALLPE